jgi:hypothetical protein
MIYFSGITFEQKIAGISFFDITFEGYGCVFFNGICFEEEPNVNNTLYKRGFSRNNKMLSKNNKILTSHYFID